VESVVLVEVLTITFSEAAYALFWQAIFFHQRRLLKRLGLIAYSRVNG
jgi:hypothetical protein